MPKKSAGLLLYRDDGGDSGIEVLLVHPGGPFWRNKDEGAWTIPKGEFDDFEEPLEDTKREFKEELGSSPPIGEYFSLETDRKYVFYAKRKFDGFVSRQRGDFQDPISANLQPVSSSLATS